MKTNTQRMGGHPFSAFAFVTIGIMLNYEVNGNMYGTTLYANGPSRMERLSDCFGYGLHLLRGVDILLQLLNLISNRERQLNFECFTRGTPGSKPPLTAIHRTFTLLNINTETISSE